MGRGDIDIHRGTTTPHRGDAWAELEQTLHQILQIGNVESIGVDINRDADLSGSDVAIAEHDSTELGQVGAMGRHIDDSSVMAGLSVLLRFRGYPQADEPIVYRVWADMQHRSDFEDRLIPAHIEFEEFFVLLALVLRGPAPRHASIV
ncbi:MAG: hypothetical protein A2V59_08805 [Armatimonadetes bacterium RBG_19FT_COMBO_69_19]|nr:MAG: hypothetical protein A2V59_08805 [Armatimonadetes bacterium RBG_19FT_COMBO_69_19]